MPLADYGDLKDALSVWMTRPDVAAQAADCITLAEAALNRELGPVEIDETMTGVVGSRFIDIGFFLALVAPVGMFLADTGRDEIELTQKQPGTFPLRVDNGYPRFWAVDGAKEFGVAHITFDCPLEAAYPFRFRYRQRFALSDDFPTNWLLTNHPDLYLAASVVWGGVFIQDNEAAARWVSILNSALPSVRSIIAQSKRAVATVDPALVRRGRATYNQLVNGNF
jgi:hypothetical protein